MVALEQAIIIQTNHSVKHSIPGPGSYNYDINDGKKLRPKRFGFGKAARIGVLSKTKMPGPGQYDSYYNTIANKKIGYSFGKSQKGWMGTGKENVNANLGPGSYDVKNQTFTSRYGFIGTGKRQIGPKPNDTPGFYDVPVTVPNLSMYYGKSAMLKSKF